jgi:hypothetical protein
MLSKNLIAAAGNAGGGSLYVEDVFSTYLYTGQVGNQTITNGIDFSGVGGLVWLKNRVASGTNNVLLDTERGGGKFLYSNSYDQELDFTGAFGVTFNNNGFTLLDTYTGYNTPGEKAVSWSFRKAEKFFDIVTYTGNGTAGRTVSHNLGSVPGCVIVKSLAATNWQVYHNGLTSAAYSIWLNSTSAEVSSTVWNSTAPTSTVFTVGSSGLVNNSGTSYVAYVFASDAGGFGDEGDESIIKCGSYTGNGSTTGPEIDLGFEPQWLMVKRSDSASNWSMKDIMRGFISSPSSVDSPTLYADLTDADGESANKLKPLATGFQPCINHSSVNTSGGNYIYIAIRRPMKTPESGTEVFESIAYTGNNSTRELNTTILADAVRIGSRNTSGWATGLQSRLTGKEKLFTSGTSGAAADSWGKINAWDYQDAIEFTTGDSGFQDVNGSGITYIAHTFKRATGFFDVVTYTGTGSARTIAHNLGVAPAIIITKKTSGTSNWAVNDPSQANPWSGALLLNSADAFVTSSTVWNDTAPTDSVFTVATADATNVSGQTYVAYLFATLDGVSKVGSYTGTAATLNVDCGFSAGARFILIKRTDSTGDWYVWDSARGIVAGNDPYLLINTTAAEVTSTDYIDPLSSGFTVTSSAPAALNASGGTYIFLAIA